ncbi:MAG: hypothetical protein IT285_11060 [Bdellovibrionales bacterium]|nr:hypothetical protein [Bdellovibrionales bacterium]
MGSRTRAIVCLVWVSAGGALLAGCKGGPEAVCGRELPSWRAELAAAQGQLQGFSVPEGRSPASLRRDPLPEPEREIWRDWAEDRLEQVQDAMDALKSHPEAEAARPHLSRAADEVVAFFGFAAKGDGVRMRLSLDRLETAVGLASRSVCSGAE